MPHERKRVVEVRLIVIVHVDVTNEEFVEALATSRGKPAVDVVGAEVVSNLESVSYVESVSAHQL
jgi:hypothetical protein